MPDDNLQEVMAVMRGESGIWYRKYQSGKFKLYRQLADVKPHFDAWHF